MSQFDLQFYEGAVIPKPKIQCVQHQCEISHGCIVQDCTHPFYCGSCTAHQHDQQDPYVSLKNIDQYIFDMSLKIKSTQAPFKSIYSQVLNNSDFANLIKWQVDLDPHFKNIENYINAQKQLISSDIIQINNKVFEILDGQKQQVFKKLDDFLMNYRIQFSDFKSYHDHLFQLIKKKYKYLGDSTSLSAKLNSLDSKLSEEFMIDLRESIAQSENLLKNSALNILDIEKVFKEMNQLSAKLPNYKQLTEFEVIPSISGQNSIKVLDQIKVQLEGHFKDACVNFFLPLQKLQIPQNQMPAKKTITFLQNNGRNSNGSVYSDGMAVSNNKYTSPPSNPQLPHSYSQPHSNTNFTSYNSNNVGSPSMFALGPSMFAQSPSMFSQSPQQQQIDGLAQSRSKPKIFQKQGQSRNSNPNNVNSPNNQSILNQTMLTSNNLSTFGQNLQHVQSAGNLQRQNTYQQQQQYQQQNTSILQQTQIIQQPTGSVLNSQYLKLRKEFKLNLQTIPKFMCYLTNGYIAMAVQGECLRILDTNSNQIINGRILITREIKFLASLQPTNEGLYSNDQPNILNFALSNIDSVISLYYFNTKTREIIQKNSAIVGFSSPVTRIADLYPITHQTLLAAGDENGEVSVFDYERTNGYGLEKCHQTAISQLLVVSNNNTNYTSLQSQLNYQPSKFISFSTEDQVLVIYSYSVDKFHKLSIFNVSNFGGGILYLRNHPEFEQFVAVCKNYSLRTLKFENKNILDQLIDQKARDIAVFSVKESLSGGSEYIAQQDPNLSGLIFTSEQDSDKIGLLKSTYTSSLIQTEQILSTISSPRKILYSDNKYRLFIIINDYNNFIQVYEIKP